MNHNLQPYNVMQLQLQEQQAYAMRHLIAADTRLYEHQMRNQLDIQKAEAIEKQKSDIRKEREYQQDYLITGPNGEEILVSEKFLGNKTKDLNVRNFTAFRLHPPESREECVLCLQFQYGPDGKEKEVFLFLDEKRLGDQGYVKRVFARMGIGFNLKKSATEAGIRKMLIEKAQEKAQDITVPEIPGWYRTDNQWEYGSSNLCWKEVTRWVL